MGPAWSCSSLLTRQAGLVDLASELASNIAERACAAQAWHRQQKAPPAAWADHAKDLAMGDLRNPEGSTMMDRWSVASAQGRLTSWDLFLSIC